MKWFKKGAAWLLLLVCAAGAVPNLAFGQYDVSRNEYISVKKTPSGKTGQTITLHLTFNNTTNHDLSGVAVLFDRDVADVYQQGEEDLSGSPDIFPFEIMADTFDAKILGTVKSRTSKSFSLTARVRRDISEGYYIVPLEVKTEGGHDTYEKINLWISKSAQTTEANEEETLRFELGEDQSTPFGIYPEVMNFHINVRNASAVTAFDVNIRMGLNEDSSKFPFDINDGNYTRHYDRLSGGEKVEVPYSMAIRKDVYSGYYPISFLLEYKDSTQGEVKKAEEIFYVRIQNKEKEDETGGEFNANDRTKARIVVGGFETNPETVYAGEEFELILHMKNASEHVGASNILFNLDSEKVADSAVFTADSGSSSIVVNSLPAGQTTDLKIKLRASAGAEQRTYALTIDEKYDSPEYKNAEEKVTVNIPVKQMARFSTGTFEIMPDVISVGAETNVMFPIHNTGKVTLNNVWVAFVGDSILQNKSYVGNIKPGETGNVDIMLTAAVPTEENGQVKLLITYEDENGVVSEPFEQEIALTVLPEMELEPDSGGMEPESVDVAPVGVLQKRFVLPALVLLIAAAGLGAFFLLKMRKKKQEAGKEEPDHEI